MYLGIKSVIPQANYLLLLTFENDEQRLFDMKPYLDFGPVFKALKDPDVFNTVHVFADTVAWSNNADLDPEILYPNSYCLPDCLLLKPDETSVAELPHRESRLHILP